MIRINEFQEEYQQAVLRSVLEANRKFYMEFEAFDSLAENVFGPKNIDEEGLFKYLCKRTVNTELLDEHVNQKISKGYPQSEKDMLCEIALNKEIFRQQSYLLTSVFDLREFGIPDSLKNYIENICKEICENSRLITIPTELYLLAEPIAYIANYCHLFSSEPSQYLETALSIIERSNYSDLSHEMLLTISDWNVFAAYSSNKADNKQKYASQAISLLEDMPPNFAKESDFLYTCSVINLVKASLMKNDYQVIENLLNSTNIDREYPPSFPITLPNVVHTLGRYISDRVFSDGLPDPEDQPEIGAILHSEFSVHVDRLSMYRYIESYYVNSRAKKLLSKAIRKVEAFNFKSASGLFESAFKELTSNQLYKQKDKVLELYFLADVITELFVLFRYSETSWLSTKTKELLTLIDVSKCDLEIKFKIAITYTRFAYTQTDKESAQKAVSLFEEIVKSNTSQEVLYHYANALGALAFVKFNYFHYDKSIVKVIKKIENVIQDLEGDSISIMQSMLNEIKNKIQSIDINKKEGTPF